MVYIYSVLKLPTPQSRHCYLFPFYRGAHGGRERLSHLPKVTWVRQQGWIRARNLAPEPYFNHEVIASQVAICATRLCCPVG